jgi:hypothetical protein
MKDVTKQHPASKDMFSDVRRGRRRKVTARDGDELAPLWAELKAAIEAARPVGGGTMRYKRDKDITVYRIVRSDGGRWRP